MRNDTLEAAAKVCEQRIRRDADYGGRFGGYGDFMGDKTGPECAAEIRGLIGVDPASKDGDRTAIISASGSFIVHPSHQLFDPDDPSLSPWEKDYIADGIPICKTCHQGGLQLSSRCQGEDALQ